MPQRGFEGMVGQGRPWGWGRCLHHVAQAGMALLGVWGCAHAAPVTPVLGARHPAAPSGQAPLQDGVYEGAIAPLNERKTRLAPQGHVRVTVHGDTVRVLVVASGLGPRQVYGQQIQGFLTPSGRDGAGNSAHCATLAQDSNHDGYVDVPETVASSGMMLVPLNAQPAAMDMTAPTYPRSLADGTYHYDVTLKRTRLENRLARAFNTSLLPATRVIYLHGVAPGKALPRSVSTIGFQPAWQTLPVACALLVKVGG
ncbi:hypothetical protein E3E12_05715 [Formicincola oecophyllae]|uniref:Uncharacterized protein n=1 Tax=Formicincola oecophyllae TaxID=2558361 RepID=A0A4Y6UBC0_9PROT|nr:hypothetical protein [Formicincola oecophyllae]QDH13766.1 hypothetical protein E3E12_05715 [Formicincola oecophyllae]